MHAACAQYMQCACSAPRSAQAQHAAARRRPTTCGRGRSAAVADSHTTNNLYVFQSQSTNIKQGLEAARGSSVCLRASANFNAFGYPPPPRPRRDGAPASPMTVTERDPPARWPAKLIAHPSASRAAPAQTVTLFPEKTLMVTFSTFSSQFRNTEGEGLVSPAARGLLGMHPDAIW
jgi:hypothetical protein